ncbi:MAG: hypothetical protein MUO76_16920, partial [Anaerolineaceae bacterium]|nr:hypothetical protein [Anaerolineaceae bacterium]
FSFIGGPAFAYNTALILTFILSGIGMYVWVRHLTGRYDAAIIAGTIFAFLPYRFAHFRIGHLNLSGMQWFPLFFMSLFELLNLNQKIRSQAGETENSVMHSQAGKSKRKFIILGGVSLGLIGLTSQYYLYMTLLVSAFLVIFYLVFMNRPLIKDFQFWKRLFGMGMVALPLILIAVAPYFTLLGQGGLPDRSVSIARLYSASPTDFILPSTEHFLWGQWIGDNFNRDLWIEGTLYIGAVAGVLAILALMKRKEILHGRMISLMFWTAGFAFILAMGIDFHWLGESVTFSTPKFLADRIARSELPIPLPGYLLFQYFPLYAKLRALMRFGVFVLIFTSASAGLGSAFILERVNQKWKLILTFLLLVLIFVDFYPGPYTEFAQVQTRPVDSWLAEQPGDDAMIQFPFIMGEDQDQIYNTLIHEKPFVGGFFNAFPPPQYKRITPIMENFPDQESVDLFSELGVKYVLVDEDEYADINKVRTSCEELGLQFVVQIEDQLVFEFDGEQ